MEGLYITNLCENKIAVSSDIQEEMHHLRTALPPEYHLIPPKRADCHVYELRNKNHVSLFKCRTERFKKSFFPTMASNAQFL